MSESIYFLDSHRLKGSLALALELIFISSSSAKGEEIPCRQAPPYEAPEYVDPPKLPASKSHLKDNGDGTLTDPATGLMWTQKDSYADLNKCLTYTGQGNISAI